ncbi:MAG: hypothetical protein WCI17_01830 [bacterium]
MWTRRLRAFAVEVVACLLAVAPLAAATNKPAASFTRDLSQGQIEIKLTAEPAQVRMDSDLFVTLRVTSPDYLKVTLPDLRERFRGFKQADNFSRDPVSAAGKTSLEQRWRLVPDLLRTYRLAPMAVQVDDTRTRPVTTTWFATRAVVFAPGATPAPVSGEPEVSLRPYRIPPTPREVLGWAALVILALLAAVLLFRGARALQRRVREVRMSPRERAFAELDRLLHRGLVAKRLYKDFYIELTMVVRRYIERAHLIRAPEQTTQEFLKAAARHPHFRPASLAQLKEFLESADLIKFAGQEATPQMADDAVSGAKEYVERDAAEEQSRGQKSEVRPRRPSQPNK